MFFLTNHAPRTSILNNVCFKITKDNMLTSVVVLTKLKTKSVFLKTNNVLDEYNWAGV